MTEDLPLAAPGTKGRVRVAIGSRPSPATAPAPCARPRPARRTSSGRASSSTGYLGERAVPRLLAGTAVQHIASPDQPHSWTSVEDVARTLEVLGADDGPGAAPGTCPPRRL
jgi:hypothetical protein